MNPADKYYHRMPDGTLKQINPFNGTEVWCVEERKRGPVIKESPAEKKPLAVMEPEAYCHFCESNQHWVTPEKARVFKNADGQWEKLYRPDAETINTPADFRRVGNLFEIVTYNYWAKNYRYKMSESNLKWKESYLASKAGHAHVMQMLELKLTRMGLDYHKLSEDEKLEAVNPFFGGCHELILPLRHYKAGARYDHELCSSGELSAEEHFQYFLFTCDTLIDIYQENPWVRYVSVFQNWLKPAGASFDHLHRQLVALDEWGVQMEREILEISKNPNIYNEFAVNFGFYHHLTIAENDFSIAVAEFGHRFPTIAVYSKSEKHWPFDHSHAEIAGMSELVHAIHRVIGNQTTCNEEWCYAPFDSIHSIPWHVLIKLRVHTPAGFEGNTKIYINPVHPEKLASEMVAALQAARQEGRIAKHIKVGREITRRPNLLRYYTGNLKSYPAC